MVGDLRRQYYMLCFGAMMGTTDSESVDRGSNPCPPEMQGACSQRASPFLLLQSQPNSEHLRVTHVLCVC